MLRKLLWRNQKWLALLGAFVGACLGLLILLFSLQIYLDLRTLLTEKTQLLRPEYLVINKGVSLLNTANISSSDFREREIERIREQPFIRDVAPFLRSDFRTFATVAMGGREVQLRTDLFFESVPDSYVDIEAQDWQWRDELDAVPIVIPGDFLDLYNFGFAPGQGMPPISKGTVGLVNIRLNLYGQGRRETMNARIVGFSDRIQTILVPQAFLQFANRRFGTGDPPRPSRLMLVVDDPSQPELASFLYDQGYETNQEKLRGSRLNLILRLIVGVVAFIGAALVLLSLLIFLTAFQLIITRSASEIRLLLHLGYSHPTIERWYLLVFSGLAMLLGLLSVPVLLLAKSLIFDQMATYGFELEKGLDPLVYGVLTGVLLLFVLLQYVNIRRGVRGLG